jgi:rhomboid protease GluP
MTLSKHSLPATYTLLGILYCIFILELLHDSTSLSFVIPIQTLEALGALDYCFVIQGQWYLIFTAFLLHSTFFHLTFNCFALWQAGKFLEQLIGSAWFLTIFFVGGTLTSLLCILTRRSCLLSVGASGAILSLYGVACILGAFRTTTTEKEARFFVNVLVFSLIPLSKKIDYLGHLYGALIGIALAWILMYVWPSTHTPIPYKKQSIIINTFFIGIIIYSFYLCYSYTPSSSSMYEAR